MAVTPLCDSLSPDLLVTLRGPQSPPAKQSPALSVDVVTCSSQAAAMARAGEAQAHCF